MIINNVKVYGIGNSKLVAAITFTGSKKGLIYLIGTPAYDPKTYVLSVPDFAFDVKTKDMLLKMAKWLFSDKITTTLREKSKYTLKPLFDQTKTRLQKELNRDINEYVGIKGGIDEINLQGIYPAKDKLAIRAISKGYLEVLVKKDMDIK